MHVVEAASEPDKWLAGEDFSDSRKYEVSRLGHHNIFG